MDRHEHAVGCVVYCDVRAEIEEPPTACQKQSSTCVPKTIEYTWKEGDARVKLKLYAAPAPDYSNSEGTTKQERAITGLL